MIILLGRDNKNKPTLDIGYGRPKIISEKNFKIVADILNKGNITDEDNQKVTKIYLSGKSKYPKYVIGDYVIYIDRGDYIIGQIIKVNPEIEDEYLIDFNTGNDLWVNARYIHPIANIDSFTILGE